MSNPFRKVRVKVDNFITLENGEYINLRGEEFFAVENGYNFRLSIPAYGHPWPLNKDQVEIITDSFIEHKEQEVKSTSLLSGLNSFFGQELKSLNVEFK